LKTVFHGVDTDFFKKHFPLITAEQDYNNWKGSINSESNGLENMYFHTVKNNMSNCHIVSQEEYEKDTSKCDIDSNSQVEYFTVLPISDEPDKISVFFCSSNTKDSRRIEILHPAGKISGNINGKTTVMEFIEKPKFDCEIIANIFDSESNNLIYTKSIFIDQTYLENKLNKNGIIQKV
ncbi:MAG: hypothetical protein RLZ10_2314, partial [Bacteroidota bacterium]